MDNSMTKGLETSKVVNVDDVQEVLSLISKLSDKQKEIVLATLRGAVLIADSKEV